MKEFQNTHELNKIFSRFNKIRLYTNFNYMNILPIKYLKKSPQKYSQIQLNTDTHFNAIIMDIDDEDMLTEWNAVGLPTPTIQTLNFNNNKAHLVWLLNVPVSKKNKKAVRYYKDIVASIKILIGADKAYQNHQTKNFLNKKLYRPLYNDVAYDLKDFDRFIIKDAKFDIDLTIQSTGSRHIDLFNELRLYGYQNAKKRNLEELLVSKANKINCMFNEPIKTKYIVKSVLKFCEDNKNHFVTAKRKKRGVMRFKKISNLTKEEYDLEVHRRRKKSAERTQNIKNYKKNMKIKVAIDVLHRKKIKTTYKNIAKQSNLSIATIKRESKKIKIIIQKTNGITRSIRDIAFNDEERITKHIKGSEDRYWLMDTG